MTSAPLRRIAAAAMLTCTLTGQAAINMNDTVPSAPDVKTGKLANGLTYYIKKNGKPEKRLELRLVVRAGSVLEDQDQLGLAHFVEHMAFNGTTHFKRNELISYLQSIGVSFGHDLNAYTSFDETVYMLPIPTDKKDNVETGFQVLEDWAHGVKFEDDAIDSERNVVLEELRARGGVEKRMLQATLPKMLNGSLYAERLPIGKEEVLKNFKYDAVKRFYRDWYRPDLMAVVAVGDIEPQEAEQLIQRHFGHLKNPAQPRPRAYAEIPPRAQSEALVVTDKEARNNAVTVRYTIRKEPVRKTFADFRDDLQEGIVGIMLAQRVQELTQQAEPPFIGGHAGMTPVVPGYRTFASSAVLGKRGAQPAIDALVQEVERARRFGFSEQELERTKKMFMRAIERAYQERDKTDSAGHVHSLVKAFITQKDVDPAIADIYAYAQELVPAVTLDQVNALAANMLPSHEQKLVVYQGNDKAEPPAPAEAALLAMANAAEEQKVAKREEKVLATKLMEQLPKPGAIVAETVDKALGTTEWRLSNGVRVVLKPTDFKNDQVLMAGFRPGGQSLYGGDDLFNARYASNIVSSMGVKFAPVDLQKMLAGKTVSSSSWVGALGEGLRGGSGSADVETMLQLAHLAFTQPRRDEALYQSFIGKQRDLARNAMSNPDVVFSDASIATLYNNDPRVARPARVEDFDHIQLDRAMAIYRERFASARDFTFVVVGSFDLAAMKPLVAAYLGSLPVTDAPVAYKDNGVRPVKGVVKKNVYKGAENKSMVTLTFTGEAPYSEAAALNQSALAEILNIKVNEVLREKLGLIYSGHVGASLNKMPYGHYSVSITLPCAPENTDKVADAMLGLVRTIQQQGPEAADLAKVKENWSVNNRRALRENGYWLSHLDGAYANGLDPATILTFEQRAAAVTPADVQAAAKRYFDFDNYVQMVLYPEAKQASN
ncbi:insulinase family protein [Pseudoduganella ginsengisoli]|uniref:Insulinase family protein n=1 Tax=Pseudoduganella ginsengisoli TaxID=1462440 RepID=A0A6L6PZV7_9BURK|nr:M16 family metallopeptidase [Pseudoduganella ginsengisoli]MTW02302.1 insulinase family protein [Pseudoduganella ginsengisoli]